MSMNKFDILVVGELNVDLILSEIPVRPPDTRERPEHGRPRPLPQGLRPETSTSLGDVTRALLPDVSSRFQPESSRFLAPEGVEVESGGDLALPLGDLALPLGDTERPEGDPARPLGDPERPEGDPARPGPVAIDEIFASLPARFDAEAASAAGASVVYHIGLSSPEREDWSITISEGALEVEPGKPLAPDATLLMSAEDWAAFVGGRLSDKSGILTGRIKVRGSKLEAMLLKSYFRFGPQG